MKSFKRLLNEYKKMEKRENKKAQAHLETVLSFVIFIGFLLFIFIYINPFANLNQKKEVMRNIENSIMKNITQDIPTISCVPKQRTTTNKGPCDLCGFDDLSYNYYAIREDGEKYVAYYSDMFSNTPIKCIDPAEYNYIYELGVLANKTVIFEESIKYLKSRYENSESSYNQLRQELGIVYDFSFKVQDLDKNEIGGLSVTKQTLSKDVDAKNIPIRTINATGDVKELILNLRAW